MMFYLKYDFNGINGIETEFFAEQRLIILDFFRPNVFYVQRFND